jgi:hypothetical protein
MTRSRRACLTFVAMVGLAIAAAACATPAPLPEPSAHWTATPVSISCRPTEVARVANLPIWRHGEEKAFFYRAGLAVSADGAPNAYHPGSAQGLDRLGNAGRPGRWWGILTYTGRPGGDAFVQGDNAPYPGFFVSTTALFDPAFPVVDPRRYVDAREIPYIVLPGDRKLLGRLGAKLGDFAYIINTKTGAFSPALIADLGPRNKLGEGSIALAKALGVPADPRTGGVSGGILFVVFPGSGNGRPHPRSAINQSATGHFAAWGGMEKVSACFPK